MIVIVNGIYRGTNLAFLAFISKIFLGKYVLSAPFCLTFCLAMPVAELNYAWLMEKTGTGVGPIRCS